jgi:hypothetical protein
MKLIALVITAAGIGLGVAPVAVADPGPVYANCTEAREAGDTDIPIGDDAYWPDGDRDGDGLACESYSG